MCDQNTLTPQGTYFTFFGRNRLLIKDLVDARKDLGVVKRDHKGLSKSGPIEQGGLLFGQHHLHHLPSAALSDLLQLLRRHVPDQDVDQSFLQLSLAHLLLRREDQLPIGVVVEFILL